ncbi:MULTISPECIES: hypothetical protein [unclassified Leclercia]|uniref:Uncharacterized protein n=1 Tax=Leclercia barmai TaxID=2785629 RepID=A0ABS7RZ73_9ENTR|nr:MULTISPECIES: hypothetical protein [unclassified Leclercia]MBZ0059607.1 hypothetical protein [Leclercia sp. EMC7]MCM5697260.1 hypothetical protein [Leclercia sp. LTM01]MCM5702144.1 hypothetical protein [Leclercia sp. LTM14]
MPVKDYIAIHYGGNQSLFAKAQGTNPQAVTRWIKENFIVVRDVVYSPRRPLKSPEVRGM